MAASVLLLALLVAFGTDDCLGKILGGVRVRIEQKPYFVVVSNFPKLCGGSILSPDWVLTAAHCIHGTAQKPYQVLAGMDQIQKPDQTVEVDSLHPHPDFNAFTLDYDYALLHLQKSLLLSSRIQPIELANEGDTLALNTSCLTYGFGVTSAGTLSDHLEVVRIPVVDKEYCKWNPVFTERMFCAGRLEGGFDACKGDSGGPFVCHRKLYGVISAGIGCGKKNKAGIYSNIPNQRHWIKETCGV